MKNLASDWSVGHEISVEFKIAPGNQKIAGLVLNYQTNGAYVAVAADADASALKILRYNGTNFVTELSLPFSDFNFVFDLNEWYKIVVTPIPNNTTNTITIAGTLADVRGLKTIAFQTALANYGLLGGPAGLFADRTYAYFNKLRIEQ